MENEVVFIKKNRLFDFFYSNSKSFTSYFLFSSHKDWHSLCVSAVKGRGGGGVQASLSLGSISS